MNAMAALPLLLVLSQPAADPASGPAWSKAAEVDGITVLTRDRPGTEVKEVKAMATIEAPPDAVWRVIRDYARYPQTMPYMEKSQILATEEGGKAMYVYFVLAAPFVAKRDYTVRIVDESEWQGGKGFFKSTWRIAPSKGPAVVPGVVRVPVNDGYWLLEPRDGGGRTLATYYLFTDPGGSVPKFITNHANSSAVPDVFRALRRQVTASAASTPP
jgi:hypothetical protein